MGRIRPRTLLQVQHSYGYSGPEVWKDGAAKGIEGAVQVANGYNLLRAFPKGPYFVSAGSTKSSKHVTVWRNYAVRGVLGDDGEHEHTSEVRSVATDGVHIASGDSNGVIWLWKAGEMDPVNTLPMEHGGRIFGLALKDDYLVSGGADKTVKLCAWPAHERTLLSRQP